MGKKVGDPGKRKTLKRQSRASSDRLDLIGKKFSKWTIVAISGVIGKNRYCLSRCECGIYRKIRIDALLSGKTLGCGCTRRLEKGEAQFNRFVYNLKKNAKTRDLMFDLSDRFIKILTKSNCFYCGLQPRQIYKTPRCNGIYVYNGIDRVDNTAGYIESNVIPCCWECNKSKRSLTMSEFFDWIIAIHENSCG